MTYTSDIEIGATYRDSITKFEGVAVSVTFFLYACERVALQPTKLKEGAPGEIGVFDSLQLEFVKSAAKSPAKPAPKPQLLLESADEEPKSKRPGGPGDVAKQNVCPTRLTRSSASRR